MKDQAEQSKKFLKTVQEVINTGERNLTEADELMARIFAGEST